MHTYNTQLHAAWVKCITRPCCMQRGLSTLSVTLPQGSRCSLQQSDIVWRLKACQHNAAHVDEGKPHTHLLSIVRADVLMRQSWRDLHQMERECGDSGAITITPCQFLGACVRSIADMLSQALILSATAHKSISGWAHTVHSDACAMTCWSQNSVQRSQWQR
jgi:hypothetical protein